MPVYKDGVEVQPTATPTVVLGTAGAQGSANTVVASDATIPAFDATNPSTQASADSPVVGVAAVAARRDHKHGMPTLVTTFAALTDVKLVRKTADETVNNSTTFQNDDELLFAIGANEVWEILLQILYISVSETPGLKLTFVAPSGATGFILSTGRNASSVAVEAVAFGTKCNFATFTVTTTGILKAIVINGANAGNVNFQWAQEGATVENTEVLTNSCLIAHRLA